MTISASAPPFFDAFGSLIMADVHISHPRVAISLSYLSSFAFASALSVLRKAFSSFMAFLACSRRNLQSRPIRHVRRTMQTTVVFTSVVARACVNRELRSTMPAFIAVERTYVPVTLTCSHASWKCQGTGRSTRKARTQLRPPMNMLHTTPRSTHRTEISDRSRSLCLRSTAWCSGRPSRQSSKF